MTGEPLVAVEHLTRRFGSQVAVNDLTFGVGAGEVLGFLGPNGAGKTTTVRTLMGFLHPSSGMCRVLGVWPGDDVAVRGRIGYLPGDFRLEPRMSAAELFTWLAQLRRVPVGPAYELADRLDLDTSAPFRTLSKGNRQKVGLVQAFFHRPAVLLLDEPSTGLDPLRQRALSELVRHAAGNGAAVVFSSHVLPEVERIADRVAVLRAGRLVASAPLRELLDHARHRLQLTFTDPVPADRLLGTAGVVDATADGSRLEVVIDGPVGPALTAAATCSTLLRVTPAGDELEELLLAGSPR